MDERIRRDQPVGATVAVEVGALPKRDHLAGLDGLRAIAVLLVMLFHAGVCGFGWIGVQIFFVLSGYLITRLLYDSREQKLSAYLRTFYGRRALRIFPLYFGTLLLISLGARLGLRMVGLGGMPFAWTYTYNFYHASRSFEHSRMLTHFWSLAVEEQFYLVWPFIVYLCPERWLKPALLSVVLCGPFIRAAEWGVIEHFSQYFAQSHTIDLYVLTPTHLDAFAIGGLLSLFPMRQPRYLFWAGLAVLSGMAAFYLLYRHAELDTLGLPLGFGLGYAFILGYSVLNLLSGAAIDALVHGAAAVRLLNTRLLRFLGSRSYGIYLFHYPITSAIWKALPAASVGVKTGLQIVLSIATASISYKLFELPLLALKDRWFPNRRSVAQPRPVSI